MQDIFSELDGHVFILTLNRIAKHNAFDDALLENIQTELDIAETNTNVRVILLRANGHDFSAGADLHWMQRMAEFSEAENLADAHRLSRLLNTLYQSKKPTIAAVQGAAFGGGAGLVAACDIAIAAHTAHFCFSEVKLGLIPAVISPYVIRAIGARAATWLFTSAERIDATTALRIGLVQQVVDETILPTHAHQYARKIATHAPQAVLEAKQLVATVSNLPIDSSLEMLTATHIAKKRASEEAKKGITAFLNKTTPVWD